MRAARRSGLVERAEQDVKAVVVGVEPGRRGGGGCGRRLCSRCPFFIDVSRCTRTHLRIAQGRPSGRKSNATPANANVMRISERRHDLDLAPPPPLSVLHPRLAHSDSLCATRHHFERTQRCTSRRPRATRTALFGATPTSSPRRARLDTHSPSSRRCTPDRLRLPPRPPTAHPPSTRQAARPSSPPPPPTTTSSPPWLNPASGRSPSPSRRPTRSASRSASSPSPTRPPRPAPTLASTATRSPRTTTPSSARPSRRTRTLKRSRTASTAPATRRTGSASSSGAGSATPTRRRRGSSSRRTRPRARTTGRGSSGRRSAPRSLRPSARARRPRRTGSPRRRSAVERASTARRTSPGSRSLTAPRRSTRARTSC